MMMQVMLICIISKSIPLLCKPFTYLIYTLKCCYSLKINEYNKLNENLNKIKHFYYN